MSVDKLVDSTQLDADLTSVANAIRTKGGTSASLAFPADFVSAIQAIPSGGGGIPVPSGCTLLDHADATGSCAIDTGMKITYPSSGYLFYMRFKVLNKTDTQIIFTSTYLVSNYVIDQLVLVSSRIRLDRITATNRFGIELNDVIEYADSFTNITNGSGICYAINQNSCASYGASANAGLRDITPQRNMILFAEPSGSTYKTFASVRFYELVYKEGSAEVMHLYPIKDSNDVVCLYDSVRDTIIYPATGSLTYNGQQLMQVGQILMGDA